MIVTEESNNKVMRMNAYSIIYDKNKEFKLKIFSEQCIKFYYYENRHMGVKFELNHNKIQGIGKPTRRYYHLPEKKVNT